jgi:hypothetical protein
MLDSPTNESRHHRYTDDPPPAYESVITPPNYHEATKLISAVDRQDEDELQKELRLGVRRHDVGSSNSLPSYSEISPTFVVDVGSVDNIAHDGAPESRIQVSDGNGMGGGSATDDNRNGEQGSSGLKSKEDEIHSLTTIA